MAILGIIGGAIDLGSQLLGNPKDAERKAKADALYQRALSGDRTAEVQLRCLAGEQSVRQEAITLGLLSQDEISRGTPCGFATTKAKDYAKSLVSQLGVRTAVADVAATVTGAAAKVGTTAAPKQYATSVVQQAQAAGVIPTIPSVPTWALAAGAAAIVYLLFIRK